MNKNCLLTETLREPSCVRRFAPADWDLLVRQARSANLLAHLAVLLQVHLRQASFDARIRQHFSSAQRILKRQNTAVRWETSLLSQALTPMGIPVVALKGTAYVLANLPNSKGRLFHDIDILVPHAALQETEAKLRQNGWRTTHTNAYDQRYYRRWMHELPPMQHLQRQTVLDVHHSILPLTARIHPDSRLLLENAVADPEFEEIYWLAPEDMVLHSMTHLFHDGELENGLRDLVDIDLLLRHFGAESEFWSRLCERAKRLELTRPLHYGLRYAEMFLKTPVPETLRDALSASAPAPLPGKLMDWLFARGLRPVHSSCADASTPIARWILYLRSHYLRMPLRLLVPHLLHKALAKDHETDLANELRKIIADKR